MRYILMFSTLFIGALLPVQAVLNTKLGKQTGGPLISSTLSFLVGLIVLLIINLVANYNALSNMKLLSVSPWYLWTGGLLGAIYVSCIIFINQQQGVALTFALAVAGQIFISLLIDHFGLLGAYVRPMSIPKIIGALLIIAGLVLIKK
ncbi:MAG TPA: DMT family transporter [Chitinophagaceae bacterium]|jgi:bacterial/archaeal transporter family-2 protein|nr:DMT family transporter [Chitinophagaceae bacterium]